MGKRKGGLFNASERDGVEYRKAKVWEILIGMANNGANVTFYLMIGFASMVATQGYGIAMALAGVLIAGTRILDGVVDPFFAAFLTVFNRKKEKYASVWLSDGQSQRSASCCSITGRPGNLRELPGLRHFSCPILFSLSVIM